MAKGNRIHLLVKREKQKHKLLAALQADHEEPIPRSRSAVIVRMMIPILGWKRCKFGRRIRIMVL
jgi:hypothetical protein